MESRPTPTHPTVIDPPVEGARPPGVGLSDNSPFVPMGDLRHSLIAALSGEVWYLATCRRCSGEADFGQPFRDETGRDDWAATHVADTGHAVTIAIDEFGNPDLHLTGVLSRDENHTFRYLCPADTCGTSNGPYTTAQSALASWRMHTPKQAK